MAYEIFIRGYPDETTATGKRLYVRDATSKDFIGFIRNVTDNEWNGAVNAWQTPVPWVDDAPGPNSRLIADVPPGWIFVRGAPGLVRGW